MKQMSCEELEGPCGAVINGKNVKEMLHNNFIHAKKYHPELVKRLSKEDGKDWEGKIQKQWEIASAL